MGSTVGSRIVARGLRNRTHLLCSRGRSTECDYLNSKNIGDHNIAVKALQTWVQLITARYWALSQCTHENHTRLQDKYSCAGKIALSLAASISSPGAYPTHGYHGFSAEAQGQGEGLSLQLTQVPSEYPSASSRHRKSAASPKEKLLTSKTPTLGRAGIVWRPMPRKDSKGFMASALYFHKAHLPREPQKSRLYRLFQY